VIQKIKSIIKKIELSIGKRPNENTELECHFKTKKDKRVFVTQLGSVEIKISTNDKQDKPIITVK